MNFAMPNTLTLLVFLLGALAADNTRAQAATAPATDKARFDILEYRVLGNTVLETRDVESAVYPLLGSDKSIDDVENARAVLEAQYRAHGFGTVFVDVPEQDVKNGVVRLRVTEGKLAHVRVTGARYFSGRAIRTALPTASENSIPHLPTLQAEMAALNSETTDRTVTPVLKAGSSPGTIDLALTVEDRVPLHTSLEVNNQYSLDTSTLRAAGTLSYDNLFASLDSFALQYQTAPQRSGEADVWAASYTQRLTEGGAKLAFFFVKSDSDVATIGDGGSTVSVLGKGNIFGSRWIAPLVATAEASHTFIAGIEYKDFTDSVFSEELVLTPISYVNLSLGHASAWRAPKRQWGLTTNLNVGTRPAGNDPEEFRNKRFRARPNYFYLRTEGTAAMALPWQLNLRLRAAGQYAVDSIISNEQFSGAGAAGVRGYFEAEELGDMGIKTSLELGSPRWPLLGDHLQADLFGFFDYGRLTHLNPLRAQDPKTLELGELLERPNVTLRSAGLGLNFTTLSFLQGAVTWAYPLADSTQERGTRVGDSRVHFSMRASW
jgi:hemolysin activation/secretion protein